MNNTSLTTEILGKVAYHFYQAQPLLPTYGHLIVAALFPIFAGAHASLSRPSSAAPRPQRKKSSPEADSEDKESDSEEEEDTKIAGLTPADAIMFPVTAGTVLVGLYYLIKWLKDPALLSKLLGGYLSFVGVLATTQMIADGIDLGWSSIFPKSWTDGKSFWVVDNERRLVIRRDINNAGSISSADSTDSPLPGVLSKLSLPTKVKQMLWTLRSIVMERLTLGAKWHGAKLFKVKVGSSDVLGILTGFGVALYYNTIQRHWWLSNIMGFGFCYGSLQMLSPTSFTTGSMVLGALFVYDIYFVFFTPVMVTVATKLDVPIKLLFPRPASVDSKSSLAMLGLGDIILPGIMIGLALRYDLYRHYVRKGASHTATHTDSAPDAKRLKESAESEKPTYTPMTGKWGERLWSKTVRWNPDVKYDKRFDLDRGAFPKPYFYASMGGYVAGMLTTLAVMQVAQHAQPALLYLVPGVLGSLWGTALVRGELKQMWDFTEEEPEDEDKKKGEKKVKAIEDKKAEDKKEVVSKEAKPPVRSGEIFSFSVVAPRALLQRPADEVAQKPTSVQE